MVAHVLIIEDEPLVADIMTATLSGAGHTSAHAVASYGAVLRVADSKSPFDVVLMDIMLQGANGAVTALALRGWGYAGPIVCITGGLMPIDKRVMKKANFAEYIEKPLLPLALVKLVEKYAPRTA